MDEDLREKLKTWSTYAATGLCGLIFLRLFTVDEAGLDAAARSCGWRSAEEIWAGDWWALITTAFVHIHFLHFFFNMYWLLYLGKPLERAVGATRWWTFVVLSAFVSSASQLAVSDGSGIGFSGVIYAFFGFMWVAKRRWPEFEKFVDKQTARLLFGWLVACFFFTHFGIMNIGNAAHLSGMLFGGAVGFATLAGRKLLGSAAAGAMTAAAVVVLFWAPWSPKWTACKAYAAHQEERYDEALELYRRCLEFDPDRVWVLYNIGLIHLNRNATEQFERALAELRERDENAAKELEAERDG